MELSLKEIRKQALKSGLILGIVLLVLDITAMYILSGSDSFPVIAIAYLFIYLLIPLLTALLLIQDLRKKIGGYWTFRQATSGIFTVFLTGSILSSIGNFLFLKANPGIIASARENFIAVFTGFMSKRSADTHKLDSLVEEIEARFALMAQTHLSTFFSGLISSIIVLFIVSLIFAAIFKKEHPISNSQES